MTLIEIMVTIVVISVLAVMIIVGGKQFKRSAAGASCCSNLRQIYTAAQAYIKDHDGYFPSIRWDNPSTLAVPGFADYLDLDEDPKNERAFRRTVMTCDAVQLGPKPSRRPFYMTYSINSAATRNYSPALSLDKPSRIPHPSKMLFFTEGAVNPTLLGFGLMSEPYNYYTHVNYLHLDQLTFPHNGYQNVLFLDGHMELLKYENFDKEKLDPLWAGN